MKEFDVSIIGDIAWNHDITPIEDKTSIGGAAYYSAVGASCFSDQVGIVSRIGKDFEIDNLTKKRIDTQGIKVIPNGNTCRFEVVQHPDGTREFEAFRGVSETLDTSIFPDSYKSSRFIHLSTQHPKHALIWLEMFSENKNISVDSFELFVKKYPELTKEMFQKANIIFTNENEWQIMQNFNDQFNDKPIIIKRGKDGAVYKNNNEIFTIPAPKVTAVDFSGAGDVLAGAFLALRAQKVPIVTALKKAVDLASYSVTQFGVEHVFTKLNFKINEKRK